MKILKNKIVYRDAVFVENLIRRFRFTPTFTPTSDVVLSAEFIAYLLNSLSLSSRSFLISAILSGVSASTLMTMTF